MYRTLWIAAFAAAVAVPAAATLPASVNPGAAAAGQPKSITRAQFLANLKTRFDAVDTNHDGYLEESEIAAAQQKELQQLQGAEQQRLDAEFSRLDANHDGSLSKQEFMAAAPPVHARETPQQMIQQLDRHKAGRVSFQDYSVAPMARFDKLAPNGVLTEQDVANARQGGGKK